MRLVGSTGNRPAVIPFVAVRNVLQPGRPESAVERDSLVFRDTRQRVRVARDLVVDLFDGDVSGDQHPAGTVLLPARKQESSCRDLVLQEFEVSRTGPLDDIGRLEIRRLQDVNHRVDVS